MNEFMKKIKSKKNILRNSSVRNTLAIALMGLLAMILIAVVVVGNKSVTAFYSQGASENAVATGAGDTKVPQAQTDSKGTEGNQVLESKDARTKVAVNLKDKKDVKLLVLGDGLSESNGVEDKKDRWVSNLVAKLQEKYGFKIETKLATSSSNNVFGSWIDFAGEIEKSDEFYDIVIICHGKNEGNYEYLSYTSAYEELVRRILKSYTGVQVLLVGESLVAQDEYYQTLSKISSYYGLGYTDLREVYKNSGKKPEELTQKSGYPTKEGYQLFTDGAFNALSAKIDIGAVDKFDFRVPLFGGMGEFQNYYRIGSFKEQNSKVAKVEKYNKRFIALGKPGESMEASVKGSIFGLYVLAGPDSGKLKVYLDDFLVKEVDLYMPVESIKKIFITNKKDYATRQVRLEVAESKNDNSGDSKAYIFGIISNTKSSDSE